MNWYRFHNSNTASNGPGTVSWTYPSGSKITLDLSQSEATNNPQWDQANIELGQIFEYGTTKNLRFHAGAQYSRIANSVSWTVLQTTALNARAPTANNTLINAATSFNGFGPRVGIDFNYISTFGLSAYAKGAVAMLAGSTKSNYVGDSVVGMSNSLPRVIPTVDAKLGLYYDHQVYSGVLSANIGWLWVTYINALPYSSGQSNTFGTPSSFELQGLYFGLNYTV